MWTRDVSLDGLCLCAHVDWPEARALVESISLPREEQARAAAFRVEPARATFVLGRSLVRQGLAQAMGVAAERIALQIEASGRPVAPGSGWQFSISHSGPWVAVAFSRGAIGCDVETGASLRGDDLEALARLVFAPAEIAGLTALQPWPERQRDFFLTVWRRKEAVLKALGLGLGGDPCGLCVATGEGPLETVLCAGQGFRLCDLSAPGLPLVSLATSPGPRS